MERHEGVERNERSPATFYNQDRYARTAPPASADATATTEWHQISACRTISWHDHRTHWMSSVLPAQVAANPARTVVIYPQWQIPLSIDGRAVTVNGRLTSIPHEDRSDDTRTNQPDDMAMSTRTVRAFEVGASSNATRWS